MSSFSLDGVVAVVTGAGAGMGAASAEALAAAGATVAVLDVDAEAAGAVAERIGPRATAFRCDVSDEDSVRRTFADIESGLGGPRVLHNNAGVCLNGGRGDGPAAILDLEIWSRTLAVNLTGSFLCTKYALPSMLAAGGGSIINTASVVGPYLGSANTAYAASKGGVAGFTRSLVITYARQGIRANAICPGPIRSAMSRAAVEDDGWRERFVEGIPAGRIGEPEDVGALVVFLASPAASYLNGVMVTVDGGLTAV